MGWWCWSGGLGCGGLQGNLDETRLSFVELGVSFFLQQIEEELNKLNGPGYQINDNTILQE